MIGRLRAEFHIKSPGVPPDPDAINAPLAGIDPLAVADIDLADGTLRVATEMGPPDVLALLRQARYPVGWKQLVDAPAVCCGVCGG